MPNTTVQIKCASEKYMNVHKNQKKDHLQTLQTILHRIGPFVFILARSSARTHTPLQKWTRFEQNVHGLNTQFKAKKPFVSILARSSARTHTPSQNCYGLNKIADGLNTQF